MQRIYISIRNKCINNTSSKDINLFFKPFYNKVSRFINVLIKALIIEAEKMHAIHLKYME